MTRRKEPPVYLDIESVLSGPDDAILNLLRTVPWMWICHSSMWVLVLFFLYRGGCSPERLSLFAAVVSIGAMSWFSMMMLAKHRYIPLRSTGSISWLASAQTMMSVALTGGLRGPLAVLLYSNFAMLLLQYGSRRRGKVCFMGGGVLVVGLLALPSRLLGSPVPDPWYTAIVGTAIVMSLYMHTNFVSVLHETAHTAVSAAIRARDDLADQALTRARELERVGSQLAHELKNPLAAIKALVQLSSRASCDASARERLDVVESEIERMSSILQGHLTFSRPLEQLRPRETWLGEIAEEALAILGGRADDAGVVLRRRGEAQVMADPRRIKEALINLVANAIEASSRGGLVEVVISHEAKRVGIAVRDMGRGMAPEVLARIGTPFFTTRDDGTGLGVVLARAAFEQHGGSLEYNSAVGEGTVVQGWLPIP